MSRLSGRPKAPRRVAVRPAIVVVVVAVHVPIKDASASSSTPRAGAAERAIVIVVAVPAAVGGLLTTQSLTIGLNITENNTIF